MGLDTRNSLVAFDSSRPAKVKTRAVTGLATGDRLVGIDRRPANGTILLLGQSSRLYTVNLGSGAATAIGAVGPKKRPVTLRGLTVVE